MKPSYLEKAAGKSIRIWVERVMIPYNFGVFEGKGRYILLSVRASCALRQGCLTSLLCVSGCLRRLLFQPLGRLYRPPGARIENMVPACP